MKLKNIIFTGVQASVVVALLWGVNSYTAAKIQPTPVYVFAHDLEANSIITKNDVEIKEFPREALNSSMIFKEEDIVGKYVDAKVIAGQFAYKNIVVDKEDANLNNNIDFSKLRRFSIAVDDLVLAGGGIRPGDRVDLIYTSGLEGDDAEGNDTKPTVYAKTFLQNVPVYSVVKDGSESRSRNESNSRTQQTEEDSTNGAGKSISTADTSMGRDEAVLTLALTLEQYEEVLARQALGEVSVISRFGESESYSTIGFVLGDMPSRKNYAEFAEPETSRGQIIEESDLIRE